ncbi:MAG: XylR N-terminal domain-containing protein [Carboxydocellales bacterium]
MEKQKFEFQKFLDFLPDKGLINFSGSRRLLFQADSLGELRRELVNSLGENIARGILTRFGYQWGKRDAEALGHLFRDKAEWILAGPMMHAWQGVEQAENYDLKISTTAELILMKGIWRHSYEAEQHLRLYGPSNEPVCWSLEGYASGYATKVMGNQVLCIETSCVGSGDSECTYEIRPVDYWGDQGKRYLAYLKPNSVVKSLGRMLTEEKERASKRRLLVQALMGISGQMEINTLAREIADYAKGVTGTECALVMLYNEEKELELQVLAGDKSLAEPLTTWNRLAKTLLNSGEVIRNYEISSNRGMPEVVRSVMGIPLQVQGQAKGVIFVINKRDEDSFSKDDEESLQMLASRVGTVIENVYLYRKINQELEITVSKLKEANTMLNFQYRTLEDSINLQQQLVGLVLEGKGLKSIVQTMGILVGGTALVLNHRNKVVAQFGETSELQAFAFSSHGLGLSQRGKGIRIVEQGDIPTGMLLREGDSSGSRSEQKMVVLPVSAGGRQLGLLIVGEAQRQFSDMDMVAIRQTATVLALEMLKGIEVELQFRTNFFDQLLAGRHDNPKSMQEQSEKLGFSLAEEHQLVLVEVDDSEEKGKRTSKPANEEYALEDLLMLVTKSAQEVAPGSAVFTKDGSMVVLVRLKKTKKTYTTDVNEVVNYILAKVKKLVPKRQCWITVGRVCQKLEDYPKSHDETRAAMDIMRKLKLPEEVLFYDQLGIYSIMFDINPQKLHDYIFRVLGNLIEYDRKTKGDLVLTLKHYVKNNYNLHQAAKATFLSPSTLKYRIKKIQEVGNLDLNNPDTRLQVELALKVIKGV